MVIVGDNLKELIRQHRIVDDENFGFDNTSICLRLNNQIVEINPPEDASITYGDALPAEWITDRIIPNGDYLTLEPNAAVLACSYETVNIPIGYFGFLQTKGSLARLFVTIHCCDSQIEPGFKGKITFEIVNFSKMTVKIKPGQKVGDLFIFKASTRQVKPYNGRYNNAEKPTIQKPET